jgi:hypothetical protein
LSDFYIVRALRLENLSYWGQIWFLRKGENHGLGKTYGRADELLRITGAGHQEPTVVVINSQKFNRGSNKGSEMSVQC